MTYLNFVSFFGIFGLCFVAWIFSEDRRVIPWRVILWGIGLQLVLGYFVFQQPQTREGLQKFSDLLNALFDSADAGARFVFGRLLVPPTGQEPYALLPIKPDGTCPPGQVLLDDLTTAANAAAKYCTTNRLAYVFAFRALPAVIFFSGFMALLENLGVIQIVVNVFAKLFFWTMRLSGAEALSGAANIFVGIEAAIVVKPYLPRMTRSELCAILACCFGTAASSTLAIYTSFLKPVFPNILGHLVSASIIAIPACFVLSKILVPETSVPVTMGGIPKEDKSAKPDDGELENAGGETMKRMSPMDATIIGALDGLKMAASIAAILILIVGLVDLINQIFAQLANFSDIFKVVNLPNIQGALFYPLTLLTGVSLDDSWTASVIIGRRLFETAIPPYQALAQASKDGLISDRTVIIVSYALSGFAHLASVGIFVGGTISLIPSRRRDISDLGWKALFVGTLATLMIACIAGVFDDGTPSILGEKKRVEAQPDKPAATTTPNASPNISPNPLPTVSPTNTPIRTMPMPKSSPSLPTSR
ncbi:MULTISPECIES: NupC/NupG family nucleoside CNT transporter [Pseudanabaena]|uniref:Na+ dependent nucleoside transporter domain protein n=2 Tax=Pseudanabaena TaxID=1152 RepID=L8MTV8_9CYAN|nr:MULTISPECIES: nucleoside transporter C-terminal domain-containing protein [Pseudanabaena]ELS30866.1 Na+ dependent nucleoside transporter domain protein [Pseudanabaena biceps PCC 7429]MDG3496874.1 nucleoside transporter C-terminal domain-containing protein [Pseudanabaena catenata USMAC16]